MKPRPERPGGNYLEANALQYSQQALPGDTVRSESHIRKKDKRKRGVEVVFDPDAHKEFVTGFHKRKVKRRKEALQQIEAKQRQQRVLERAEKREQQRKQLNLDRYDTPPPESDQEEPQEKTVYRAGDVTMTVTTAAIQLHSDIEEGSDADIDGGQHPAEGGLRAKDAPKVSGRVGSQGPQGRRAGRSDRDVKTKLRENMEAIRRANGTSKKGKGKGKRRGKQKGEGGKGGK